MESGTILIVDDNPINVDILQQLLMTQGYEVRPTTSGKLALKYIQKYLPDLFLLDIKMPDMDGFEILRQLKANPNTSEIPVIFISAIHDTEEKVKAFSSGAVDYITKPFHEKEILCRIKTHMSLRKIQQNLQELVNERTEELIKRTHELKHAQKMEAIGTLAGGIAHDFNNILTIIMGYTDIVLSKFSSDSKEAKNLSKILIAVNRAKELVRHILSFSRYDEQNELIRLKPSLIINETMKMLHASLPKTIEIKQNITKEIGTIMGDPAQIQQIVMNLCTNAFHAMEKNGGILNVELKNTDLTDVKIPVGWEIQLGKPYVKLIVSDTGEGIAPEIIEKIFDPYFTTKEIGKGTGLGLAIVHGIVRKYKGAIIVESLVGKGTEFSVVFPVVDDEKVIEENLDERIKSGNERILFVDDELMIANTYDVILKELGYIVTIETNPIKALEKFQKDPYQFDIVITDQTMPIMTGDKLAINMLKIRSDIPIVLCTGYSSIISKDEANKIGIKEFVFKPVRQKELLFLIRKLLDK